MIAPYEWGGRPPKGVCAKTQCLYGENGATPPLPLLGGNKIPIGRKNKIGTLLSYLVLFISVFLSFLIYLFLKEEGGVGVNVNGGLQVEEFEGVFLGGKDRGVTWN